MVSMVPGTYMIDECAIIRSSYVNPNLIQRQSPEEIAYMAGISDNRSGASGKRIGEDLKSGELRILYK